MQASAPKSLSAEKLYTFKKTTNGRVFPENRFTHTAGKSCIGYSASNLIPQTSLETTRSE